ncbi:ThiF family adenylyltransferase [Nonomuraea sp. NPDC050536]|uniref:ThiF family adenylyltransferase n=1 Tax=Nonomuraea sp. NPDC050536 TaxID=3364366 RepID=UPI0037C78D00
MEFSPERLLAMRRSVQAVPEDSETVVLISRSGASIRLTMPGFPLLEIVESIQAGTTFADLVARFFPEERGDAGRLLAVLHAHGLITNPVSPDTLPPPADRERFDRLIAYFGEFETSTASRYDYFTGLRDAHVIFVGLGSMTSWILGHLVASGVGRITGIDDDRVALSNLARQAFFTEADVGLPKVDATKAGVYRLSTLTDFQPMTRAIGSPDDALDVLRQIGSADLVILTADQPLWLIADWTSQACARLRLPLLRANVHGVGPIKITAESACPACELYALRESPGAERLLTYRAGPSYRSAYNSATISTEIAIQGAVAAHEAIGLLTGAWPPLSVGQRLRATPRPQLMVDRKPVSKHPDCVACRLSDETRTQGM